jgi:imidazolonepropionase
MQQKADIIVHHVEVATMVGGRYGLIHDGAVVIQEGAIRWVGPTEDLPDLRAGEIIDGGHRLLTPGLIDCHTHIVYGGNRADEFEARLRGATYEEIARRGGGIMATVRATRAATAGALAEAARPRVQSLLDEGVTMLEIKTGYGLNLETESKMIEAMERLSAELPVEIVKTFLGAHTLPPEFQNRPDAYVDEICKTMLPEIAHRVEAVDVFCETIGFTPAQTRRIFNCARNHGLAIKLHAEQLSNLGGAALGAEMGALSADHLEHLDEAGVRAMAHNHVVAVVLPGALYTLGDKNRPPMDLLRQYHVPIAVATDANPGTSPIFSLLTVMNMACVLLHLTPEEALAGVTCHAAQALNRQDRLGTIEPGKQADLVCWNVSSPAELSYYLGYNPCHLIIHHGKVIG